MTVQGPLITWKLTLPVPEPPMALRVRLAPSAKLVGLALALRLAWVARPMLTVSVSGQAGKTFHASFNTPPQTFLASEDSYTYDATTSANTNFGTSTVAMVKADAAGFNRKSYFKFNLGTYSSAVKSANVTLTAIGSPGATTTEQANEVTSAWTEGGITWNNSPSVSSTVLSTWSVPVLTGTSTFSFDVTPAIQDAMTAGTATPSVQVSGATSGSLNIVQYATRETTATASRPVLTIHQN